MVVQTSSSLKISEIYLSLQGESTYAGLPCVFVRLSGCSLRCVWCDTAYANEGCEEMSRDQILEKVGSYGARLVEVTGGEPLEQDGVYGLMEGLLAKEYRVLLETNGAMDLGRVPKRVVKIMDIKCPGSGMESRNLWTNLEKLVEGQDEIKFVIQDKIDYEYAKEVLRKYNLAGRFTLLFSPVTDSLKAADLAQWIVKDLLPVRLQLQMHKVIWPNESKGR
jgi:7-carboxy-7-deazaguanine synthase